MRYRLLFVIALFYALSGSASAQSPSDIYAAVKQSAVDKVVNDAQYPVTFIDEWWPFTGDIKATADRVISGSEGQKYRSKAQTMDCSAHPKEVACVILSAYTARDQLIDSIRAQRDQVIKAGKPWNGPDDVALLKKKDELIDFKAHLAHLKINLLKAPGLTISGTANVVKDVSLDIDVIGELWWNHPAWNCTKTCQLGPFVICCEGHIDNVWEKAAEFDLSDFKITTDATVTLSVNGVLVYGTPSVQYLALDYPILRDINVALLANLVLAGRNFLIMDASKIVAAIPYVNTKYTISSVALSGNGEIRADITILKIP